MFLFRMRRVRARASAAAAVNQWWYGRLTLREPPQEEVTQSLEEDVGVIAIQEGEMG